MKNDTTVAELRTALNEAKVRVIHYVGDQRYPPYTTLKFVWEKEQ